MKNEPVLPGEYSNWKDTGCEIQPLCLKCPLPHCLEDKAGGKKQMKLNLRAADMRQMRLSGECVQAVADAFGVSIRTVHRELKREGNPEDEITVPTAPLPPASAKHYSLVPAIPWFAIADHGDWVMASLTIISTPV